MSLCLYLFSSGEVGIMLGLFYRLSCLLFVMVFIFVFFRRSWYNVGAVLQIELSTVCHGVHICFLQEKLV